MTHSRIYVGAAALLSALLTLFLAPVRALPPDNEPAARSVPLPYVLRTDAGTTLSVNPDGSVSDGQGNLFNAGAQLFVGNNAQYAPENGQASFDAGRNELLFPPMPVEGLLISRRVGVNPRGGWFRFVESLENPGQAPVHTQIHVRYGLCGAVQGVEQVGDDRRGATPAGVALFDGDDGIAVLGAGRGSVRCRPRFVTQADSDALDVAYDVEVAPHKTACLVHAVAVRGAINDAANFIRTLKESELLRGLPPEVLRSLVNFRIGDHLVGGVEVLRGELFDVIELRGGDLYKGTLREKVYSLQTPYGLVELPAERVLAMVTLGQYRPTQLLVTSDGEVFGGTLKADAVKLELSSGQVTSVPLTSVRRLGYRRRPDEPEEARPPAGKPLVMLRAGDRIAVEPPRSPLVVATCYGDLKLDPRNIASVAFQSEEHGVHEVRLVDGSRFAGVVAQERFDLTRSGIGSSVGGAKGAAVGFAAQSIKRIQFAPDVDDPSSDAPRLELSNGDVLVGGLSGKLTLETAFDAIDVDAEGLQGVRQGGGADADLDGAASGSGNGAGANEVQLTLWDGTTVSGGVRGDAVDCALRCGTSVRVPVGMVRRYTQPSPRPPPQVVKRIKAVVAELNADDWKARDAAARQLASIGAASAAVLKELRDDQPPEVRQRIDHILASFEKKPEPAAPASAPPPGADAPADVEAPAGGPG